MRKSPSRAMCKGLPTFRAGGMASPCIDYGVRADEGGGGGGGGGGHKKTALTPTYFSHDHFSSSLADTEDPMLKRTRVTVKVMEGKNLLVSDLSTGTSDPVAHLWVGSVEDDDVDLHQDKHVQSTEVCKHTVDPVWDAEFIFPLEVQSVEDVLSGRLNIRVRDHDDADGDVHYLDLGRVTISLETVLTEGNIMAHTQLVQLPARWFPLQRCHGMRKSQGELKIAVGFFVGADSVLLRGDDSGTLDDNASAAARFEHHMRRIRGYGATTTGSGRTASMSPARRGPMTSRSLTARGGTTNQRPKSAPGATTLTSPSHLRQRPFELKPIQPRFPVQHNIQTPGATQCSDPSRRVAAENSGTTRAAEAVASEQRPRWQDTYGSTERQLQTAPSLSRLGSEEIGFPPGESRSQQQRALANAAVSPPPTAKHVRSSNKLSRLAAKASRASLLGSPQWGSTTWGEDEGATVRAHRWQRRLLECMQRLEARSTEASAYGELRVMIREASSPQVGQVVAAARTVGSTCSLAARRYTLRLLAWLCWDQPQAAGKFCGGIVEYVLDRIRDEETASLCGDLTLCVGAVMLSALRSSFADASLAHTRRFLRLVGEQRASVRVAAGACCAAAVLPPPSPVPVEMETHVRSIEDVRLAVGKAAGRVGVANAVPKEAVLLPGGRALIELADAGAATEFFNRISIAAGHLPRSWSVFPFPKEFCAEVKLAEAAHHARLTVNSEEILACLVEALGSGRSDGTRAELFNAVAAMARSCAIHGHTQEVVSDGLPTVAELEIGVLSATGLAATLRKGLPAIAQAVSMVLDCPVRRAFAWKERKAALDLIVTLAVLRDLRGPEGPLGEHRLQLVRGATTGKRDSVAAVREAAVLSLEALEATGAEETERETRTTGVVSCLEPLGDGSRGVGGAGMSVADMRKKRHQSVEAGTFPELENIRKKTLDGALRKWERAASDAADAAERKIERFREHRDKGRKNQQRQRQADVPAEVREEEAPVASSTPSALLEEERTPSSRAGAQQQECPTSPHKASLSTVADEREEKGVNENVRTPDRQKPTPSGTPGGSENVAETGTDDVDIAPPDREDGADISQAEAITTRDDLPKHGHQECDIPPARLGGDATPKIKQDSVREAVSLPGQQPLPTTPSPTEDRAQVSMTSIVPKLEQEDPVAAVVGAAAVTVTAVAAATATREGPASILAPSSPSSLLPPMNGGLQADTARLLQHLCNKTDSIASVLESLGQRVVGMERTLESQEPVYTAGSPTFSPPRQLKRPRSVQAASPNNAPSPKGKPDHSTPSFVQAPAPKASVAAEFSSARSTTRVRRQIALLVRREDFEQAFRLALTSGTERDVLRLMGSAGGPDLCRRRLGMETRDRLFAFLARTISGGLYAEHALPWVFELVRAGEARALTLAVRMQLAGALHGLAASPTDQGVMAAKLGPYLSLTSVGRSSLSDAAAGGGVFSSLEVAGGRA